MKSNILLLCAICITIPFRVHAQKKGDSEEVIAVVKNKTVKMPKYPLVDFPKKSPVVSEILVMHQVIESVRLGFVLKGLDNQVAQIKPNKNLTVFLQDHVNKMYDNDYNPGGLQILLIVKDLRIAERSEILEYSYLRFKAAAYVSNDRLNYMLAKQIDTVFFQQSGMDVTSVHGQEIEDALKLVVESALKNIKIGMIDTRKILISDIKSSSASRLNVPILMDNVYTEGAYANFQEFLQNKPGITDYAPVVEKIKKVEYITRFRNKNSDSLSVWGVCKNGELYRYVEKQLVPIEKSENGFIISYYIEKENKRNSNSFMGGLGFGLLGYAAVNAIAGKNLLVTSIPNITKSNRQPKASMIDMETGELTF